MRARLIYEYNNFERGKDLKDSMKIGSIRKMSELKRDYSTLIYYVQNERDDLYHSFVSEATHLIPDRYRAGWVNIRHFFDYMSREELFDYDRLVTKYLNLVEKGREKIEESVGFERGKNPKDALKLGRIRDIEDMQKKYKELKELVQTRYLNLQSKFGRESVDIRPERLKLQAGWGNISNYFPEMTREELYEYDQLITKYINLIKEA